MASCSNPLAVRPTVKIGLVAPFEGRYRYVGYDVIYAARLAIREVNAGGGVGGYSVELVAYDDGADCDEAARCAQKLAIDGSVVGMVGHFTNGIGGDFGCEYQDLGLPLIAVNAYDEPEDSAVATIVRLAPPALVLADAILDLLESEGAASPALVADGGPTAAAIRDAAQRRGIALAPDVSPASAELVQSILAADPDSVIIDAVPHRAGGIASALHGKGWRGLVVGGHNLTPTDFAAVAGPAASASCVTPWPLPQELSGGADFVARYEIVSGGIPPGRLALPAYEATWMLIDAIEADIEEHGRPSRQGVGQVLARTYREGLLGPIVFGPDRVWDDAPIYRCEVSPSGGD